VLSENLGKEILFASGAFLEKCEYVPATHAFIRVMCSIECFADPMDIHFGVGLRVLSTTIRTGLAVQ